MIKQLLLLALAASPLAIAAEEPAAWDLPREMNQQERWSVALRNIREQQFPAVQQGPRTERTCGLVRLSQRVEVILDSIRQQPGMIHSTNEFRALHSATVGAVHESLVRDGNRNICPGISDADVARLVVHLTNSYVLQVEEDHPLTEPQAQTLQQLATNRTPR